MKYAALLLNFKLEGKCKQWYKWYQSGSCVPSNSHPFSQGANTSSTDMPGLDKSARKSFTDPLPPTRCSVSNTALSLSRQVFFLLGPFYQHSPKYQLSSRCSPVSLLLHRSVGAGGRGGRQQQASTKDAHRKSSAMNRAAGTLQWNRAPWLPIFTTTGLYGLGEPKRPALEGNPWSPPRATPFISQMQMLRTEAAAQARRPVSASLA